jgi:hypothetical protein
MDEIINAHINFRLSIEEALFLLSLYIYMLFQRVIEGDSISILLQALSHFTCRNSRSDNEVPIGEHPKVTRD